MAYRTTRKMTARKEARRLKLLETAQELFGRQGYHATTVPQIVERAKSSTGSFYFYYRNKEDVFAAVLEHVAEELAADLNVVIASQTDPILQMKAAVKGTFHFFARNPGKARILLIETAGLGGRLETLRSRIIQSHERSVEESLRSLLDRLPPLDPQVSSYCWVGAVHEAVRRWLEVDSSKRLRAEEIAEGVANYNLRAIGLDLSALEKRSL